MPDPRLIGYVSQLLTSRLRLVMASKTVTPVGKGIAEEVLAAPRVMLFTAGQVRYTVEGQTHLILAPAMLLLPAWLHRTWKVVGRRSATQQYATFTASHT